MFLRNRNHLYGLYLTAIRSIRRKSCKSCEIPSEILNQIDQSSMMNTVKKYRYHLCIGQSIAANQWPKDIKTLPGNYIQRVSDVLSKNRVSLGQSVKLTSASVQSSCLHDYADWYLFPAQIKLSNIHLHDIEELIEKLFINNSSIIQQFDQTKSKENNILQMTNKNIMLERLNDLWILVCCHEQHDRRCGVIGPILIDAIEKYLQKTNLTDKVHCLPISHIGGHRFAGNVIIYPSGTWYGRVLPTHIPLIIDAYTSTSSINLKDRLKELLRGNLEN